MGIKWANSEQLDPTSEMEPKGKLLETHTQFTIQES